MKSNLFYLLYIYVRYKKKDSKMSYWNAPNYVNINDMPNYGNDRNYGNFGTLTMPQSTQETGSELDLGQILAGVMNAAFNITVGLTENSGEKSPEDIQKEIEKLEGDLKGILSGIGNSSTLEQAYQYYQDQCTLQETNNKKINDNRSKMTQNTTTINTNNETIRNNNISIRSLNQEIDQYKTELKKFENPLDETGQPRELTSDEISRKQFLENEIELLQMEIEETRKQNDTLTTENTELQNSTETLQEENNRLSSELKAQPDIKIIEKNYNNAVKIQKRIDELKGAQKNASIPGKTGNMKEFNEARREWLAASQTNDPEQKKKAAEKYQKAYNNFGDYASSNVKYLYELDKTKVEEALKAK